MANYVIADPFIGAPLPVTETKTAAAWPVGLQVRAYDRQSGTANVGAGVFQYVAGSNVTAIGQFVQLQGNNAKLLTAGDSASKFPIAVAAGNLSSTNVYGWVQIQGIADYARGTNSAIAAGVPLYIAAGSAGYLLTNVVAGNHVHGVICPVSYTSSQSQSLTVQLNYPCVIGVTAGL